MSRTVTARKYGRTSTRSKAERLFAELPQTPSRQPAKAIEQDSVNCLSEKLSSVCLEDETKELRRSPRRKTHGVPFTASREAMPPFIAKPVATESKSQSLPLRSAKETFTHDKNDAANDETKQEAEGELGEVAEDTHLRLLTWDDVCPPGDEIVKIAEASFAEVYRVSNDRGTSIIKVIRLPSPIKPQTKAQIQARLVDELPHREDEIKGELQISEWLAEIPGFVVYKEQYIVQGKGTRQMLETHQKFQRRMKRRDPGRAQFYPSPSRYLEDTRFLVVELGDAGTTLENWTLADASQLWDIFFLEAIALARAEELVMFEHRDLHEGNLCIRQSRPPTLRKNATGGFFGYSGLDITILDYGLARAEDLEDDDAVPIAYDMEKDMAMFSSTHGPHCEVYRQMRSFFLRADRKCLPPSEHKMPYQTGIDGPLNWEAYAPYTNVLWLAYLYRYLVGNFKGERRELLQFKDVTRELWAYLDPDADDSVPCFGSAADIVHFAVEAGWVMEEQLAAAGCSLLDRESSIIVPLE